MNGDADSADDADETRADGDAGGAREPEKARGAGELQGAAALRAESVRAVRLGHGANCSSVGSVIDTLFVSAAVGGAILAAILAAMQSEPVRVVGGRGGSGSGSGSDGGGDREGGSDDARKDGGP